MGKGKMSRIANRVKSNDILSFSLENTISVIRSRRVLHGTTQQGHCVAAHPSTSEGCFVAT